MLEVPPALLAAFPPAADRLLDSVRRRTDDAMLWEIARADYGMQADELMDLLRPIRDRGAIPDPLPFLLWEVLALSHHHPAAFPPEQDPTSHRGHLTRLFACAVLLRAEAEVPRGYRHNEGTALAGCVACALLLGEEFGAAAACYLTWRLSRPEEDHKALSLALPLLILATPLRRGRLEEPDLGAAGGWVLAVDVHERRGCAPYDPVPRFPPCAVHPGYWRPIFAEFERETTSIRDDDVRTDLQLCSLLLDPDD